MKVKMIKTGKTQEYNNAYAARLVEQGKAIPLESREKAAAADKQEKKAEKGLK